MDEWITKWINSCLLFYLQVVEDFLQIPQEISEEEDTEESTLTLADRIRAMEFDLWHDLLDHLFSSLLIYMRCVQVGVAFRYYCIVKNNYIYRKCYLLLLSSVKR